MHEHGELTSSATRRPQAPKPSDRTRPRPAVRLLLPLGSCLALLLAPLLLSRGGSGRTVAVSTGDSHSASTHGSSSAEGLSGRAFIDSVSPPVAVTAPASDASPMSTAPPATTSALVAQSPPATTSAVVAQSPPATTPAAVAYVAEPAPPTTEAPPSTSPPTTAAPAATTTTTSPPAPASSSSSNSETGPASWYDAPAGTCAHPYLPFGTVVTVTNLANGATTTCQVEDRGPYQGGRIIDLSEATFSQIASTSDGVIQVHISW